MDGVKVSSLFGTKNTPPITVPEASQSPIISGLLLGVGSAILLGCVAMSINIFGSPQGTCALT